MFGTQPLVPGHASQEQFISSHFNHFKRHEEVNVSVISEEIAIIHKVIKKFYVVIYLVPLRFSSLSLFANHLENQEKGLHIRV